MTDRRSILLLSSSSGAGHAIAARAIEEELSAAGLPVVHLDAYQFVSPATRWASTELHLNLLEASPTVYGSLYRLAVQSEALAEAYRRLPAWGQTAFVQTLLQLRPSVVFSTHAIGCLLAAPLKSHMGFRLGVLTTDYYSHAFHRHARVDCYCASHEWTALDLQRAGVPQDRIAVTGIPLRRAFDAVPDRESARRILGLPLDRPLVLVTGGGMTTGQETVVLLEALLRARELASCVFVAVLGHRLREYQVLTERFSRVSRLRLERFVDTMETFLAAADIVIGKAGGLSSTETFAVGRPLILYAPNAGVEAPNVARFVAAGAALDAGRSPQRVIEALRELFASPARQQALVTAGKALMKPGSRPAVRTVVERLVAESIPLPVFG
ncbi:MAG: monogalactosyldiacylglycerol synthase [Parcubacteria group bacterium Gr01-1014_38]|nr:MAG: monogalactosyldiacylglycerol synthase [Parcubacteria group bacterium Gr01-1014_38]